MKACHACGQKLPLKVGEVVSFSHGGWGLKVRMGVVTKVWGQSAAVLGLHDGLGYEREVAALTRLHGYYRITEREPLA